MSDFRKPHGSGGGNQRNNKFGKREFNRPSFGNNQGGYQKPGGRDYDRPQMYSATCSQCGKACEVPFRPSGQKPVFCQACFNGNKPSASAYNNVPQRDSFATLAPKPQVIEDKRIDDIKVQLNAMQATLDRILQSLASAKAQEFIEKAGEKKKVVTPKKTAAKKK